MIQNGDFVAAVKRNAARATGYKLGASGDGGECDCIGLIIGAIRLCGGKWSGVHGTNYAARNKMRSLLRIADASELAIGDLVYKAREPGQGGYDLPSRYASSTDKKDYYHVGVVTGLEPLEITHCTSVPGAIRRDSKLGKWQFAGRLKMVGLPETEGKEEMDMELNYRVIGGNLNQRAEPSMEGRWLQSIPNGTRVHAEKSADPAWLLVDYNDKNGYCKAEFLEALQAEPETDQGSEPGESVTITRTELAALRKALEAVCVRIDQILTE